MSAELFILQDPLTRCWYRVGEGFKRHFSEDASRISGAQARLVKDAHGGKVDILPERMGVPVGCSQPKPAIDMHQDALENEHELAMYDAMP